MQQVQRADGRAWYGLSILVVVYIFNFIDRQILSILANDIKADLGLTDAELGFLYGTAFAVFYALFGIPLGKLADSWSRVRLMSVGLTVWSAMTAFSGFASNGATLTAARVGVGIGEATASPAAYSLLSDWFPKNMRATALAIYTAGSYIGVGASLLIGAQIVERWNLAYPGGGPLGLVGWQAAFLVVGTPGIILAFVVASLKEPVRGQMDGMATPPSPTPFADFARELFAVIPPFTLIGATMRGTKALIENLIGAAVIAALCYALYLYTGTGLQWLFWGVGIYAIFSWATSLRVNDPPTYALIWKNRAFLCTVLGYSSVAFTFYAFTYWAAPYAERVLGIAKTDIGWLVGAPAALTGIFGLLIGGQLADRLGARIPGGRILVVIAGVVLPVIPNAIAFTTTSPTVFYISYFVGSLLGALSLGGAAATTQDLVLPRMRAVATASFLLASTMLGLALGPYVAGQVSTATGDLGFGVLSTLIVVPFGVLVLFFAYKAVPDAEANLIARAKDAGETGLD